MVQSHRLFPPALLLLAGLVATPSAFAATTWTQPTPEELKMTSDPNAPGAAAEYLYLQISYAGGAGSVFAAGGVTTVEIYARIKVFNEKGREESSDVRMDYVRGAESISAIDGRTIHSDGTIIPFTGRPYDKEIASFGGTTHMQKVFSMPDVQVGSILEYRYEIRYPFSGTPIWYVQQGLFVRKAQFHFQPSGDYPIQITQMLPPGAKVTGSQVGGYNLAMENIPALPDEDFSPPMHSLGYRVEFLYSPFGSGVQFWKNVGRDWSGNINETATPSGKLKDAVNGIVAPGDSDQQKVEKIYAAVMKLENTSFTRERTKEEDKAQRVKLRNASDVWAAQRANRDEMVLLFVAMVRAAKMKAYAMYVADRSNQIFLKDIPDANQLDDMIAIVNVDGKDLYLDPGERYCEFGKLKWTHTWTGGIRQTDFSGAEIAATPTPQLTDTQISRRGEIQMDADGGIHGTLRVSMTGDEALHWRQEALRTDEQEARKKLETSIEEALPAGVHVHATQLANLTDSTQPLLATFDVSGSMGTRTGHRLIVPAEFFEAQEKVPFASDSRTSPVYMRYPYVVEDQFKLILPANAAVESVPQDAQIPYAPNADFVSRYRSAGTTYQYARRMRVANILYDPKDYAALRGFFQKVNGQDQEQLVLKTAVETAGAAQTGRSE